MSEATVLLVEVAAIQATLASRIAAQSQSDHKTERAQPEEDRLLTVEETATRLGVRAQWLYRHAKQLPFARKLSRKALRFSEAGLRRWQAARTP